MAHLDRVDTSLQKTTAGYQGQEVDYSIPVSAYPTSTGIIIINSPGAAEPKEGHKGRYAMLGPYLQEKKIGTLITYNPPRPDAQFKYSGEPYSYRDASWSGVVVESLSHVVEYALENAQDLCSSAFPTLYLAGFSAGGSACGAVAYRYPQVKKILFISTYDSVGVPFYNGIQEFTGSIYITYGSEDPMAGWLAQLMRMNTPMANALFIQEVPNCDHGFSGPTNSKILRVAYSWAFAGEPSFPLPNRGCQFADD